MNIHDFDDIRPFTCEELPEVYERLISDDKFKHAMSIVSPQVPYEGIAAKIRSCKTNLDFQKELVCPFLRQLLEKASKGMTFDFSAIEPTPHTFITNHRDIVLDSAFLSLALVEYENDTVEIAIGDNLLIHPWIKDLVRINRSFIVQRTLTMRQMLMASKKMSQYINYVINGKKSNVWIAQREGRAKDSNDLTQESVLKMLAMGADTDSVFDALKSLNIVPTAISYEYDPCDYLKAEEFQNKRDMPGFKKSQQDDLDNMRIGIFGYKGQVHYQTAPCINDWLDSLRADLEKKGESNNKALIFELVAKHIDKEIHKNYKIYPINEYALEALKAYNNNQTIEPNDYIENQLSHISLKNPEARSQKPKTKKNQTPVFRCA